MKIELRNFFKNIFKDRSTDSGGYETLKMLNSYSPYLLADNNKVYDNLLMRACIDTIAKHTAKLMPKVIGYKTKFSKRLEYLLTNSPNVIDSRYDFFYKVTSQLLTNNNAFVYINYADDNTIEGLYPVPYSSIEFLEKDNKIYCKFYFKSSGLYKVILPYSELIHLRRHYNDNDLFGSGQSIIVNPVLKLFKSFVEGFVNAVNASSMLRGYLKYAGNLKGGDLKVYKENFVKSYMQNGDGIGALDGKCDFVETKIEPYTVDSRNQLIANNQVYLYYGVSEDIIKGTFNEDKFNAFYSNTIEPLAIQIAEEFSRKIFTERELELGRKIVMSASRLTFANNSTKMNICKEGLTLGMFTFNECREVFEFEPVEGGDKRIVSLNYVDADKANEYQGVGNDKNKTDPDKKSEQKGDKNNEQIKT